MPDKTIFTEEDLNNCYLYPEIVKQLREDLSDSWTCLLCDKIYNFQQPVTGLQRLACHGCGQTCLRPTRESGGSKSA